MTFCWLLSLTDWLIDWPCLSQLILQHSCLFVFRRALFCSSCCCGGVVEVHRRTPIVFGEIVWVFQQLIVRVSTTTPRGVKMKTSRGHTRQDTSIRLILCRGDPKVFSAQVNISTILYLSSYILCRLFKDLWLVFWPDCPHFGFEVIRHWLWESVEGRGVGTGIAAWVRL